MKMYSNAFCIYRRSLDFPSIFISVLVTFPSTFTLISSSYTDTESIVFSDDGSQEKQDEIPESEKPSGCTSKPEKPDVQSQDHTSASPVLSEPTKITAL